MGWPPFVTMHKDFPLINFTASVDAKEWKIWIGCTDKRTGEIVQLSDPKNDFPSGTLVAAFRLLCGPIPEVMTAYNKSLNRRQDRGRRWQGRRR